MPLAIRVVVAFNIVASIAVFPRRPYPTHRQTPSPAARGHTRTLERKPMKHYGVEASDLLPGAKVANPELTGNAIFRDGTKALTW